MVNELKLIHFTVSNPVNGKRYWTAEIDGVNFNSAAPLMVPNAIESQLQGYGTIARVRTIDLYYEGGPGITIGFGWRLFDGMVQHAETQVVTLAAEYLHWDLDWLIPVDRGSSSTYSLYGAVTGYAATDDLYIYLNGEVW